MSRAYQGNETHTAKLPAPLERHAHPRRVLDKPSEKVIAHRLAAHSTVDVCRPRRPGGSAIGADCAGGRRYRCDFSLRGKGRWGNEGPRCYGSESRIDHATSWR